MTESPYLVLESTLCPATLTDALPHQRLADLSTALQDARRNDLYATYADQNGDPLDDLGWPKLDEDGDLAYTRDLSPTEQELVNEFCATTDATILNNGIARIVMQFPDIPEIAVKVGRWGPDAPRCHGPSQNYIEARLYDTFMLASERAGGECLLPVIAGGTNWSWIAQPRAVTLKDAFQAVEDVYDDAHPARTTVSDAADPLREYISTEGCLPENIGRWQGDWYLLDYGRPRDDDSLDALGELEGSVTNPLKTTEMRS